MTDAYLDNWYSTHPQWKLADTQIASLKQFFHGESSPLDAAKQLARYPEAADTPMEMRLRVMALWELLTDTAVKRPSTQPSIISLLRAIRTLPKVNEPSGEGEEWIDLHDGLIWHAMMHWADDWYDCFNSWSAQFLIEKAPSDQERQSRKADWTSACAFAARLDATDDEYLSSDRAGLERATGAIADALESDCRDNKEPDSLSAAAEIFKHAASTVYARCLEGKDTGMANATDGDLWNGERGFNMARWAFWEERWAGFARNENFSSEARGVAEHALAAMKAGAGRHNMTA
ncbi:hypothetical protein QQS21_012617 [Conoideocrella luteorostrata]|uniref:Uncharacterized protein n=1 Tax=Conoideocrella luteorostrata TaxID=1105319 RepID=A0AAJ0FM67_9HYPO|nr:hypothetical protein QQS21_012617 [Conoideocrella luteorostrata]